MNSSKVKSQLLPIYIVKEDPSNHQEIGRKKINFQINYGNVYRINYKYFTPKGYQLAKGCKPEVDCKYGQNGLNVKSITFRYVKQGAEQNQAVKPKHRSAPIHVSYIDIDNNERMRAGSVTGKYGQTVNVLDQVALPAGYQLCGGQKSIFKISDHDQSIDLMIKRKAKPQTDDHTDQASHQDHEESSVTPKPVQHPEHVDTSNLDQNIKNNIKTLESNLQKYDCDIAVQLVHEVLNHDLNFFKKVITAIFSKMKYRGVDNLKINPQKQKVSGVIKKCLYNNNHVNFTFVRACKYNIKHQVTISEVRDFVTSVMDHNSSKGVFITTSRFSPDARKEAKRHSIILIDDMKLAQLMIQNNVGVKPKRIFRIVNLDRDFF